MKIIFVKFYKVRAKIDWQVCTSVCTPAHTCQKSRSLYQVNRSNPPEGTRKIAILRARSSSRFALRSSQHFQLVAPRAQTQSMFPARSASRSDLVNTFSSHRFALRPSQRFQLAARSASRRYTWGGTSIILIFFTGVKN